MKCIFYKDTLIDLINEHIEDINDHEFASLITKIFEVSAHVTPTGMFVIKCEDDHFFANHCDEEE